ncbi:MAG TPA: c-type cytochrome [Thermoanaerobaculia bacterium]|nr:c-type cytochrome [Thermoanaerobaculia bacterium]
MRRGFKLPFLIEVAIAALFLGLLIAFGAFIYTLRYGFSTHDEPTAIEAFIAGRMRHWSIPADLHQAQNPLPLTPDVLAEARAHFADHCATCHANDGKGKTEMGQHLYPRAPDMTLRKTQSQSDGELFATIENGVRLTGMPGWGDGTAESARGSWALVHFIRHLPKITADETAQMENMNPKTPQEYEEMQQEQEFLAGSNAGEEQSNSEKQHHH